MNQYESQLARQQLEDLGLTAVGPGEKPDVIVVRTCCVTGIASSKSRQAIARAHKTNPVAKVIASGCLPSTSGDELRSISPQTLLVGRDDDLAAVIKTLLADGNRSHGSQSGFIKPENSRQIKNKKTPERHLLDRQIRVFKGQTRAFLKVQDGCDAYCTYCIIPKIRDTLGSKPLEVVLEEARGLVAAGHKEIVLTGIFLGAYNRQTARRRKWRDNGHPYLAQLVNEVAQVSGLARLRLSSLEPGDITDELLNVIAAHPNVAGHLHLPLQSGSDGVLRRMGRQYRRIDYLQVIEKACARLDRPAITTDIIAGFPGETEAEFRETLELAQHVGFAKMHIFPFSLRKGTAAERLKGHLPAGEVRRRAEMLGELDVELQQRFRKRFAGERIGIIIEKERPPAGRCERYFMVTVSGSNGIHRGDLAFGTLCGDGRTATLET